MEVSGKLEAPAGLTLGKESPVPMNGRLGGPKASQLVTETKYSIALAGN
jgi:hypothetical protein